MKTTSIVVLANVFKQESQEILEDIESQLVRRVGELRAVPFEWGDNLKSNVERFRGVSTCLFSRTIVDGLANQ